MDEQPKGYMETLDDGSTVWHAGEKPESTKLSKASIEKAREIVKLASVTEWDRGLEFDMIAIVGVRHESKFTDRKKAENETVDIVAGMLERGELTLADDWSVDAFAEKPTTPENE